ncbi:MAG: PilN domain-containing protein [Endozoicomonas sp.]
MAKINLLPWREQLRDERKKRFIASWVLTILLGVAVIFLGDLYITNNLNFQQGRNLFMQNELGQLEKSISEIKDLKRKRAQLLERMKVIQSLQGNRPVIVRVFDQLARVLPEGVYFKSVQLNGSKLVLVGVAESNSRISALMRNFDASEWFSDPNLTAVRKVSVGGERLNEFDLTVLQISPNEELEES